MRARERPFGFSVAHQPDFLCGFAHSVVLGNANPAINDALLVTAEETTAHIRPKFLGQVVYAIESNPRPHRIREVIGSAFVTRVVGSADAARSRGSQYLGSV